tara:strand:+ start:609 stop:758 length:150 start_codon:yes stop_codon:yes gene_type:complete
MSHHIPLFTAGAVTRVGYARITNDGVVLSIWLDDQQMLFLPEHPKEEFE